MGDGIIAAIALGVRWVAKKDAVTERGASL